MQPVTPDDLIHAAPAIAKGGSGESGVFNHDRAGDRFRYRIRIVLTILVVRGELALS